MSYTDNPLNDYAAHEAEQIRLLGRLPICDKCGQPIQDEYYYIIDNIRYCEECLEKLCKVDNYDGNWQ